MTRSREGSGEDYSTTNYGPEERILLGKAVRLAREAMGLKSRPKFLARYGTHTPYGINKKSLELLERGQPGVGGPILRAVGRALRNWSEDTPRQILEREADAPPIAQDDPRPELITDEEIEEVLAARQKLLERLNYPPPEVDQIIAKERREIIEARATRAPWRHAAG